MNVCILLLNATRAILIVPRDRDRFFCIRTSCFSRSRIRQNSGHNEPADIQQSPQELRDVIQNSALDKKIHSRLVASSGFLVA